MRAQSIKLNLVPGGVIPVVNVSQYDVGRPLQFVLWDGKSPATIESGTTIDIRATKPDGHGFMYACTYSGNTVSVSTQAQMTVLAGSIECELHLVKNSMEIGTANFILEVEQAALKGDTDTSETELPAIIDMARSNQAAAAASAAAAATSATNAANSATAAASSQTAAATSATNAANSATAAATSKADAEAYAVGKRNGVDVGSDDVTYNNNAKHYAEVAEQAAAGGIIPQGTCTFETLPSLSDARVGDMWNISNDFTTTADFREGASVKYGAGANVYKTADGKWDVMAGKMVMMQGATASAAGAAGSVAAPSAGQQNHYWTGGGSWANNTENLVTNYTSSDNASETGLIVSSGETAMSALASGNSHGTLFSTLSKATLNVRKLINTVKRIWNTIGAAWVSGKAYVVNDMVIYTNGHIYRCKSNHTSSNSILPTNTTYWEDTTVGAQLASSLKSIATLNTNYTNITSLSTSTTRTSVIDISTANASKSYTTTKDGWLIVSTFAYGNGTVNLKIGSNDLTGLWNNNSGYTSITLPIFLKKSTTITANVGSAANARIIVYTT